MFKCVTRNTPLTEANNIEISRHAERPHKGSCRLRVRPVSSVTRNRCELGDDLTTNGNLLVLQGQQKGTIGTWPAKNSVNPLTSNREYIFSASTKHVGVGEASVFGLEDDEIATNNPTITTMQETRLIVGT